MYFAVITFETIKLESGFPCKNHRNQIKIQMFSNKKQALAFIKNGAESNVKYLCHYLVESESPIDFQKWKIK